MKFILKRELIRKIAGLKLDLEALTLRVEELEKAKKPAKKATKKAK